MDVKDHNNRKPICRLHFTGKKKQITLFDTDKEEKINLNESNQIYEHTSRLIKTVESYKQLNNKKI